MDNLFEGNTGDERSYKIRKKKYHVECPLACRVCHLKLAPRLFIKLLQYLGNYRTSLCEGNDLIGSLP